MKGKCLAKFSFRALGAASIPFPFSCNEAGVLARPGFWGGDSQLVYGETTLPSNGLLAQLEKDPQ